MTLFVKNKAILGVAEGEIGGQDTMLHLTALAELPLEERYVWRVVSALKWAFCDLDTESANCRPSYPVGGRSQGRRRTSLIQGAIQFLLICQRIAWGGCNRPTGATCAVICKGILCI
jgi:hypothetical protein